jgi:cytochrome c556
MTRRRTGSWLVVVLAAAASCVPAPQADYTPDELRGLSDLKEVMRVMYQAMKPTWALADASALAPADFQTAATAAARVEVIGETLTQSFAPGRPEGFGAYAGQLRTLAQELARGAASSDPAVVKDSVTKLGQTCDSCHGEFR